MMKIVSESTGVIEDSALRLKQLAAKTKDLPPIPAMALKALQMLRNPKVSVGDLQAVIGRDQALVAKILRIVNSAMYGLRCEVSTVSHAITLLGMETLRSVIMAASVQHVFQSGTVRVQDLSSKLLAEHSWGTALCARKLAQYTKCADAEESFLCGLMHDIGKPVLMKNFPDRYGSIVSSVYQGEMRFHEAEMGMFGFSHAHLGAVLAEQWNFPPQLSEGIGYHHNPLSAPDFMQLACITNLSNLAMLVLEIGFEKNKDIDLAAQPSAKALGLTGNVIEDLLRDVRAGLERMPSIFKS
jgi:putative nucleotidyltransferase with HDIG domain